MTVNCQEAMAEAQASERIPAPASDASAVTIESLRARLLSERAASKEARQQAQQIAEKVSELQARLDSEIEYRKKAEAAMDEVLEVLKAKGLAIEQVMSTSSLPLDNLEGEEMVSANGSKDVESEHSSGEEACNAHMEGKPADLDDTSHMHPTNGNQTTHLEDCVMEHERHTPGYDSLVQIQCNLEDNPENDHSEVDNCVANSDDRKLSHQHVVSRGHIEDVGNGCLSAGQGPEESNKGDSEQSCRFKLGRTLSVLVKHAEGLLKLDCKTETDLHSEKKLPDLPSANHLLMHQEVATEVQSDASLSGGHKVLDAIADGSLRPGESLSPGKSDDFTRDAGKIRQHVHWLQHEDIQMPSTESLAGFRLKEMHSGFSPINGLPYDAANANNDLRMHDVSTAETSFASNRNAEFKRGHVYFPSTSYHQSRDPSLSEGSGLNRNSRAHTSDTTLTLMDDKNGKLGDILMALHLAKQQLRDEGHMSSYTEEKPSTPTRADGKAYVGYHGDGDGLYQPPYHSWWRPEVQSQAPIIHFPVSPTSDHGFSAFERHDGLRRSSSVSANFMMPGFEAHVQSRGEVQLGNGITLYTD